MSQDDPIATLFWNTRTDAPESVHARARELASNYLGERVGLPLAPGDVAGSYEIVRVLGAGGQAVVYEAVHKDLGRHVALKVPRKDTGDRLVREAKLMASLEHPSIVQVLDLSLEGPVPYLVLELCEKGSLDDRLEIVHPDGLPLEQVHAASIAILDALGYAHKRGVVHRDVKPANVLYDKDNQVRVADFGIGTIARADELSVSHDLSQLSLFAGTPLYLAPEQENPALRVDGKLDGRADLFAFGKLLFQMLTGASPRTIRPPSRLRPGLDAAWDEFVFKLTEERPERRFDSAEDALFELPRLNERRPANVRPSDVAPVAGSPEDVLFGKFAIGMRFADRTALEQALAYQKSSAPETPLSELLHQRGILTRGQVAQILERQRQMKSALGTGGDLLLGTSVGGCRLLAKLGEGGMGVVYRALHETLMTDVVVKVLAAEATANPRTVERFKREALVAAKLEHPNIAQILNVGTTDDGRHFMVMEYVEGKSLEDTLTEKGAFSVEGSIRIALDVARALAAAHGSGVIHRDIRADNILLMADGGVKVSDFGLAKDLNTDMKLTADGAMIGTPLYMAPEIGRVKEIDGRVDIYSLGVVLYYLLTGVQPFRSFSAIEILSAKAHDRIVPPGTYLVRLPETIRRVLGKMLEKDRDRRYRDADALIRDLEAISKGQPVEAREPTLWKGVPVTPAPAPEPRKRIEVRVPPAAPSAEPTLVEELEPEIFETARGREHQTELVNDAWKVRHPNVLRVLGTGNTPDGKPGIVYERPAGRPLNEMLDGRPVPWPRAVGWILEAARALEAIHRSGLVHGHVRPDLIHVDEVPAFRVVKLGGLGRVQDPGIYSRLTRDGALIGSPFHTAPEILQGRKPDARSDIYSLGCVFYQALTGRLPFETSKTSVELYRAKLMTGVPAPSIPLPEAVGNVLGKMVETDPGARYRSATELVRDLEALENHEPVKAGPPSLWRSTSSGGRARRRGLYGVLSIVSAAGCLAPIAFHSPQAAAGSMFVGLSALAGVIVMSARDRAKAARRPKAPARSRRKSALAIAIMTAFGLAIGITGIFLGRVVFRDRAEEYEAQVRKIRADEKWLRDAREADAEIRRRIDDWIRRGKPKE